jgi:2-polyprenyl-6-methoxyphenol hydroxylase-like FAD-dependent oxidoreductase
LLSFALFFGQTFMQAANPNPMHGTVETSCCIAGGGPAGMMLGFLLARMGGKVIILEKHADFLRDFRGDTIHPSTLDLMYELGLLPEFLKLPHQVVKELSAQIGQENVKIGDFTHLPTHCKMIALMPQWDFLNFLVRQGHRYQGFNVCMNTEATDVIEENGRILGVMAKDSTGGTLEVRAPLTIAADGRHSRLRERARMEITDLGAPMDVLWFSLTRRENDPSSTLGHAEPGVLLIMINRGDHWQCGYVIAKGALDEIRKRGMDRFHQDLVRLAPFVLDRVAELRDWNQISLLTVKVDRLKRWWRPGLLCIGDAAHAMSPIGGVGINLAIQDAVAAANILGEKLIGGRVSDADLEAVERRRTFPMRATQELQLFIQKRIIERVLRSDRPLSVPWPFKLMQTLPFLRRIPARVIGIGFRPEHIHTPERL